MSWERRGRQLVYYRARRVNGRVVKDYYRRGDLAEFVAAAHFGLREERRSKLEAERGEREQFSEADSLLNTLEAETNAVVRQVLTAARYHQHKAGRVEKGTRAGRAPPIRARPVRPEGKGRRAGAPAGRRQVLSA
jgi:hypothetical protein